MKEARIDESLWFDHEAKYRLYPWRRHSEKRGRTAFWVSDGSNLIEDADAIDTVEALIKEVFGRNRSVWLRPRQSSPSGGLYRLGERAIRGWGATAALRPLVEAALGSAHSAVVGPANGSAAREKRAVSAEALMAAMDAAAAALPVTERDAVVKQRIGQSLFRDALLQLWESRCAVSGLEMPELLRASHSKPWARCIDPHEQLDPFNGLLLAPQLDLLFDRGYVTFDDQGKAVWSSAISMEVREALGVSSPDLALRWIHERHMPYLGYHRSHVFRDTSHVTEALSYQPKEPA